MKDIMLSAILFMTGVVIFDVISLIRDLILRYNIKKNPQRMARSKCNEVAKKGYCLKVLINDNNNTVKKTAQIKLERC